MKVWVQQVERRDVIPWFIWAERYISSALEHAYGELTTNDILRLLLEEKMQLFLILRDDEGKWKPAGAAVTEVVDYCRLSALRVVTMGGDGMREWFPVLDEALQQFARGMKCTRIESACRVGFVRGLEPYGYKRLYVILGKEVEGGESSGNDSDDILNGAARVSDALH